MSKSLRWAQKSFIKPSFFHVVFSCHYFLFAYACYKITYRWLDLKVTVLSAFGIKISNCLVGENLIVKFLGLPRFGKNASLRIVQRNLLVMDHKLSA